MTLLRGRTGFAVKAPLIRVGSPLVRGSVHHVAPYDDEDDWVGVPPEGHYSRDRAKPEFWRNRWPLAGSGLIIVLVVLVVILLTR
jgi:hypothetical protein